MTTRIVNGAFVHRIWGTLPDADLIGHFQYFSDAKRFAQSIEPMHESDLKITITDQQTGEMFIVTLPSLKPGSAT